MNEFDLALQVFAASIGGVLVGGGLIVLASRRFVPRDSKPPESPTVTQSQGLRSIPHDSLPDVSAHPLGRQGRQVHGECYLTIVPTGSGREGLFDFSDYQHRLGGDGGAA